MPDRVSPRERFQKLDAYRVEREWQRYSGTAQRELFRVLRERFLSRHRSSGGWIADLGSGPGRFTDLLGPREAPRVLLDLSDVALQSARDRPRTLRRSPSAWHLVRGDAARPPLRSGGFGTVALLGNLLGFSEGGWEQLVDSAALLVPEGGTLLIESVAGPGESSIYLARLPLGALTRTLAAPINWVAGRVASEGFRRQPAREKAEAAQFRRLPPASLSAALVARGFRLDEILVVAAGLGASPERVEAVHADPKAWERLIALEERIGADAARWPRAAAYLVAATRASVR